jgi:shikimate dehydrogenase
MTAGETRDAHRAPDRPYAEVIGDPIFQSKSPLIHNFWLDKLDLDAEYRATRVRADSLNAYLAQRKVDPAWRGCNVTIPHKQAAIVLVAGALRSARQVGAANIVYPSAKGLMGANSDVDGVLESLDAVSLQRDAGSTVLIGAGGAARAALYALDVAGLRDLRILARRPARAEELLDRFGMAAAVLPFDDADVALRGANTLINASPLGMTGQPRMPASVLEAMPLTAADALVFDMVYAPLETQFLGAARHHGRRAVDGLTMLIGQADLSFQMFFQAVAPRQHDAELRALLMAA